jgi:GntR family transcriptional regulator/MocR family aminotransferase
MELHIELMPGLPLRRQLERQLREAIRSGRLRCETAVPPSRVLAGSLGVSRGVVVDAYSQLVAEGYLVTRRGGGTRVAYQASRAAPVLRREERARPRIRYDLRPGQPDFASFPRQRWQAALLRSLRALPDADLTYGNPRGLEQLRVAVADHLARARAAIADPEHVIVCAGLAHGLSNLWFALARRGATRVAVEDPGWRWQARTVEHAGLTPVPIPVDEQGLVVSELERAEVDAVAVTPAHQFPTGVVMSPDRRSALLEWARRRGTLIVEDDYDAEYRYDREPVAALQGLAPDCVALGGTTSKTLAPGLRLAWMVLPSHLTDDVTRQYVATFAGPPVIEQAAAASFLNSGELDRHLRRTRRLYRTRRDALIAALAACLPEVQVRGAAAGLHVLARLPDDADDAAIAAEARRRGVAVHALHRHCTCVAPSPPALLLGYAQLSQDALQAAIRELAAVIQQAGHRQRS